MLVNVQPDPLEKHRALNIPAWLAPLIDCAPGVPFADNVNAVLKHLGFETMVYGAKSLGPEDERVFVWTTAPEAWVREYDRNSYVEIDPRVRIGWELPLPLIWDSTMPVEDPRSRDFLERAAQFGIGSGVAVYFVYESYAVMLSLNRRERILSRAVRAALQRKMGDSIHFGYLFHWLYMRNVIQRGFRPEHLGAPLSPREHQCVHYAAHGMTSNDIAVKLGITERTANFHFSNLISKLGVLNRHEAIAKAVSTGIVRVGNLGHATKSAYFAKRLTTKRKRIATKR
jgi:DNA-binding CsgD family transcriptional regulator